LLTELKIQHVAVDFPEFTKGDWPRNGQVPWCDARSGADRGSLGAGKGALWDCCG